MSDRPTPPITTDDLHAFADGKLPPTRAAEVEAYLAGHPEAARQVADYRAINAALHKAFDGVLEEAIPAPQADIAQRRLLRLGIPAAAAVAGLLVGLAGGWLAHGGWTGSGPAAEGLADRARAAYLVYAPETRHPVEVSAADSGHLATWLSNRMGMTFTLPRLDTLGFTLVGGRLLAGETGPAALLMYQNDAGRRLVLYVGAEGDAPGRAPMRYERDAGASVVSWRDGPHGFALSGAFPESELRPAAEAVRTQFGS